MADNKFELIAKLRERTGAGMMDCKKALEENGNDLEKATAALRKKGVDKAATKATRIASEGLALTFFTKDKKEVLLLEVNCETDFVSRGEPFKKLVNETANILLAKRPKTVEEAKAFTATLYSEATMKIGEKLDLRRFAFLKLATGQFLGTYVHTNAGLYGTLAAAVVVQGGSQALADNIAMHIASTAPKYISLKSVPSDVVTKEKNAQVEAVKLDPKNANKPADILTKIIDGKVARVFADSTLEEQPYLLSESGELVKVVLAKEKVSVASMTRFKVGEGLEKRADDFASEVMLQVNKNTR